MRKGRAKAWLGMSLVAALMACGGGGGDGSNDQGIVFRGVGFVRGEADLNEQIRCEVPTVQDAIIDSAWVVDLNRTRYFPDPNSLVNNPCGGYIALENNLSTQAINVQQIVITYDVPGAAIVPPETTIFTGIRINSASSTEETASGQPNLVYAQLIGQMLPETIVAWLNQNINVLPSVPFQMIAQFEAYGQSDNGTRYVANPIDYQFTITR